MDPVGSLSGVVLEARDPEELAPFYSGLTGLPIVFVDGDVVAIGEREDADFHVQPAPDRHRVFTDPAGHPFCLVPAT